MSQNRQPTPRKPRPSVSKNQSKSTRSKREAKKDTPTQTCAPKGHVRQSKAHAQRGVHSSKSSHARSQTYKKTPQRQQNKQQQKSGAQKKTPSPDYANLATMTQTWPKKVMPLIKRKKRISLIVGIVLVCVLIGGIDALLTSNRIYQGISVGSVDVSGMTQDEASAAIQDVYGSRFETNRVVFFKDEEAKNDPQTPDENKGQAQIEEQLSYEEALSSRTQWTTPPAEVGATFDPSAYAQEAYLIGRDNGGFFSRLRAQFGSVTLEPQCEFNDEALNRLAEEMTKSVGSMRLDSNISMENGQAVAFEGHDGNEVTTDWVREKLNVGYLGDQSQADFVLQPEFLPSRITFDQAKEVASTINRSIGAGIVYTYKGHSVNVSRDELAQWITTRIDEVFGGYNLVPVVNEAKAKSAILKANHQDLRESDLTISFERLAGGSIQVSSNATGEIPDAQKATEMTNRELFGPAERHDPLKIEVTSVDLPHTISFEEALDIGLISEISSFTTQFSSKNTSRVTNISLASEFLNNSICKANGGTWSFNETAGEATADKGYKGAGAIVDGEYSDAVGGGICQVATTVFNAVYEAGYPIVKRYNHSLYIASYPKGRDAAISYPNLDLVWENNTTSDVLLQMSSNDSSVSAKLYGVDPGYEVTTTYGDWQEGEPFKTVYKNDPTRKQGTETVQTTGTNGSQISIERIVKDSSGSIIDQSTFTSVYRPKDKVILRGTK